jgi:hypothetical protein
MHDVNPLGPMMHLKELERQAVPRLRSLRPRRQDVSSLTAAGSSIIAFLQQLHTVRLFWRVVRRVPDSGGTEVRNWPECDRVGVDAEIFFSKRCPRERSIKGVHAYPQAALRY